MYTGETFNSIVRKIQQNYWNHFCYYKKELKKFVLKNWDTKFQVKMGKPQMGSASSLVGGEIFCKFVSGVKGILPRSFLL